MAEPTATVPVYDPHAHKIVRVAPHDIYQAELAGAHRVSEQEANEAALQEKYGGPAGTITAGAAGLARGLSLGLSDAAIRSAAELYGGEDARKDTMEYLHGAQEANPITSIGSEVAGVAAPLILSGGAAAPEEAASLSARGAIRGAGFLPRAVTGLGHATEHAVSGLVGSGGTSFLGRAAQKTIPKIAGGGIEGALFGAGASASEQSLEDQDLSVEKVLAEMPQGALLGGGIAAAPGIIGTIGRKSFDGLGSLVARKAEGATVSKALGLESEAARQVEHLPRSVFETPAVSPVVMHEVSEQEANVVADAVKKEPGALAKFVSLFRGGNAEHIQEFMESAEGRNLGAFGAKKVVDEATREITESLTGLNSAERSLMEQNKGINKLAHITQHVSHGGEAEAANMADALADSVLTTNEGLLAREYGTKSSELEYISRAAWDLRNGVAKAVEEGGPDVKAKIKFALDGLKREVQNELATFEQITPASRDTAMRIRQNRDAFRIIEADLRKGLENEAVWGQAAINQKRLNAAWARQISASQDMGHRLMTTMGRDPNNPFLRRMVADPAKISSYISGLTDPDRDLVHQIVKNYVSSTRELAMAMGDSYSLPSSSRKEIETIVNSANRFERNIDKAATALSWVNKFEGLGPRGGAAQFYGPLGAAINPQNTIRAMAMMDRISKKVDAKILHSVNGFLTGSTKRMATIGAKNRESAEELFKKSQNIASIASNAELMNQHIEHAVGHGVTHHAPNVAGVIAHKLADSYEFLASKAPLLRGATASITPQFEKARYSEDQALKFGRYLEGVQHPLSILDDMNHGTLSREKVEAVRATSPRLYDQIRETVINQCAELDDKLSYDKKLQLGILFQAPTDETLTPVFIRAMQQTTTTAPPAPEPKPAKKNGGGRRPIDLHSTLYSTGIPAKGEGA